MTKRIKTLAAPVAAAAVVLGGMQAAALPLDLDINGMNVDAGGAFDANFTGSLTLSGRNVVITGTSIASETLLSSASLGSGNLLASAVQIDIDGQLQLTNGEVTGGSFTLFADPDDTVLVTLTPNSGTVTEAILGSGLYQIGALGSATVSGDGLFASLGVSGVSGDAEMLVLDFAPDVDGADVADMELRVVPTPATALLIAPAVAGLVLRRRRA